jgi:hypothetical protein
VHAQDSWSLIVTAAGLVGLLAEPERLAVVAAVVLGAQSPAAVVEATGLGSREVARAVQRLHAGGLLSIVDGRLAVDVEVFKAAARAAAPAPVPEDHGVSDPGAASVLRVFIRNGRLVSIPASRGKRLVVLEHLAMGFEPGIRYPEREVDALLRAWHDDYAALRRYLVDEGLLGREAGEYWRTGGWIDPG